MSIYVYNLSGFKLFLLNMSWSMPWMFTIMGIQVLTSGKRNRVVIDVSYHNSDWGSGCAARGVSSHVLSFNHHHILTLGFPVQSVYPASDHACRRTEREKVLWGQLWLTRICKNNLHLYSDPKLICEDDKRLLQHGDRGGHCWRKPTCDAVDFEGRSVSGCGQRVPELSVGGGGVVCISGFHLNHLFPWMKAITCAIRITTINAIVLALLCRCQVVVALWADTAVELAVFSQWDGLMIVTGVSIMFSFAVAFRTSVYF